MRKETNHWLPLVLLYGLCIPHTILSAAEPVKTGKDRNTLLYIRTDPPGAKVFVNGKEMGTSNDLFPVKPGKGTILVELEGRKSDERQVIIRANAITRLELSLEPRPESQEPRFIGHFPQGTVELVGITDFPPTEQSRWWKPNGSRVDLNPFLPQPTGTSYPLDKAFLLHFNNLPGDTSARVWKIKPSANWNATGVLDPQGNKLRNHSMLCAKLGTDAAADLRVGIDTGTWETVAVQKIDQLGASTFSRDGHQATLKLLQPETFGLVLEDSTRIPYSCNDSYGQWKKRLLAVTSDGNEHVAWLGAIGDKGAAVFWHVSLSSIEELRLQIRPYTWVEFKNISLQPEQETDVKVISSGSSDKTAAQADK